MTLDAIFEILSTKAAKRNLSLKIFDPQKMETAGGNRVRQVIKLQKGLSAELAKKISKLIRDNSKANPQIQGDVVRVVSKSRDELQSIIALLKQEDLPVPLEFTNYR
jgi:cyclic-di-GMP-binding protein